MCGGWLVGVGVGVGLWFDGGGSLMVVDCGRVVVGLWFGGGC